MRGNQKVHVKILEKSLGVPFLDVFFNFVPFFYQAVFIFLIKNSVREAKNLACYFPRTSNRLKCMLPSRQLLNLTLAFTMFSYAQTQISHHFCISIIHSVILSIDKDPKWLFPMLILLSHDVHMNPGPRDYRNNFFQFMNWNLNSLAKDDFSRLKLLEAHNSLFNYDIISLCETSLTKDLS